jgi:hypothetical protein
VVGLKISGKFRGVGFGPQNFREIFDHRKFRHNSCKGVKILFSSADRTPTDMSLAWPDADRLKRRKPPYQLMAASLQLLLLLMLPLTVLELVEF